MKVYTVVGAFTTNMGPEPHLWQEDIEAADGGEAMDKLQAAIEASVDKDYDIEIGDLSVVAVDHVVEPSLVVSSRAEWEENEKEKNA